MNQGFSPFSWALAVFCLPSALFPLALLISPQFSAMPQLTPLQIDLFSVTFWCYPLILFGLAILLHKIHKIAPLVGKIGLALAFIGFYAGLYAIVHTIA